MVNIYSTSYEILGMFLYPFLSTKRFNISETTHSYFTVTYYTDDELEYRFILDTNNSLDITIFNESYIVLEDIVNVWGTLAIDENRNKFFKLKNIAENNNVKVIVIDASGDDNDEDITHCSFDEFLNTFDTIQNMYLISSKMFKSYTSSVYSNQIYLPLIYYYFYLKDSFYAFPTHLNFSNINKSTEYDFISYLGLDSNIIDAKKWRKDFLNSINFGDKKILIPNTFIKNDLVKNNFLKINKSNHGMYNWYNMLEARNAKIKIVFETFGPNFEIKKNVGVITEKTFKCFIDNQPYILFINYEIKKLLKELGFKFVCPDVHHEYTKFISNLCEKDLNTWILDNNHIFEHNKNTLMNLIYSNKSPHIKILQKIINNENNIF